MKRALFASVLAAMIVAVGGVFLSSRIEQGKEVQLSELDRKIERLEALKARHEADAMQQQAAHLQAEIEQLQNEKQAIRERDD